MSDHGGGVADASPYLGSITPVVMTYRGYGEKRTHRPSNLEDLSDQRPAWIVRSQLPTAPGETTRHGRATLTISGQPVGWLMLLARSAASKDAGLVVLGHRWRCYGEPTYGRGWTRPIGRSLP